MNSVQKSECIVEVKDPNAPPQPTTEQTPAPVVEAAPASQPPAVADGPGKIVQLKTHQIGQLKREAGAAAQRKLAAEMGFGSVDEMKAAAARMKNPPKVQQTQARPQQQNKPASPASQPGPQAVSADTTALQREVMDLRSKNEKLAREKARAERTSRERQRQSLASQAESELRSIAAGEGITDLEYAIHLIRQHTNGMDEAKLRAFDERAYFRNLRGKYPYLFNQVQQPANSGLPENPGAARTGSSVQMAVGEQRANQPPAPAPRQPGGRVDTSKMSRGEFQEYLRGKGISTN